jgi:hypothetical protein
MEARDRGEEVPFAAAIVVPPLSWELALAWAQTPQPGGFSVRAESHSFGAGMKDSRVGVSVLSPLGVTRNTDSDHPSKQEQPLAPISTRVHRQTFSVRNARCSISQYNLW